MKQVCNPATSVRYQGFTLVEMLIAIGLSSIVIFVIGSAIQILSDTTTRGKTRTEHARLARSLLRQIEVDFRSIDFMIPDEAAEEANSSSTAASQVSTINSTGSTQTSDATDDSTTAVVPASIGLQGTATSVKISVSLPAGNNTVTKSDGTKVTLSGKRLITYSLGDEGTDLKRLQEDAAADATGVLNTVEQLLASEVKSLSFKYYDGSAWADTWDSQVSAMLPMAIEVNIGLAFGDVYDPQQSYRYVIAIPLAKQFQSQLEGGL